MTIFRFFDEVIAICSPQSTAIAGWVERSETHHVKDLPRMAMMGIAFGSTHPTLAIILTLPHRLASAE
ncbi:MAG: hypothetical protein LBE22_01925 [Azoarcus sp.]|nr:hypothetical protein [Azoarcus sp.]